jgi:REP element-mobilizing transposase RayT
MPFQHFYRRRLPHFQHDDATYFVTSRLFDSLPAHLIEKLAIEHESRKATLRRTVASETEFLFRLDEENRRHFGKMDRFLHQIESGSHFFRDPKLAAFFLESALFQHQKQYDLICQTVMSNHVHLVFSVRVNGLPLHTIMGSLKKYTSRRCNEFLNRRGAFWQDENWDRIVRDADELERIVGYVLENPVKAGLVADWRDWPFTWLNPDHA